MKKSQEELIAILEPLCEKSDLRTYLHGVHAYKDYLFACNGHMYVKLICKTQSLEHGFYVVKKTSLGKQVVAAKSAKSMESLERVLAQETCELNGNPVYNTNYISKYHRIAEKIISNKHVRVTFSHSGDNMLVLKASNDNYLLEAGIMPLR